MLGLGLVRFGLASPQQPSGRFLQVTVDRSGPVLILASAGAERLYGAAIRLAQRLHPQARRSPLDPRSGEFLLPLLREIRPAFALVFLLPEELDVRFAWKWLETTSRIDDDPFVDLRSGFFTGATPQAVMEFVERIGAAVSGSLKLPAAAIDQLGPNTQMPAEGFSKMPGSYLIPALARLFPLFTISHGRRGFSTERLAEMTGAGLVHFSGHGYPDRIVDCLNGPFARRVPFSPCVIFNGACYTGVTGRWIDVASGAAKTRSVSPSLSFCLGILANQAVAYLAALHADHGMPVYQEMEYLLWPGGSLGDAIKHTQDGVVLGGGGKPFAAPRLEEGTRIDWTPAEIMRFGTASRVLFGDPTLRIETPPIEPPLVVTSEPAGDRVRIWAEIKGSDFKSTFVDTFHADLSANAPFNGRVRVTCAWRSEWGKPGPVRLVYPEPSLHSGALRLVAAALESDRGRQSFHVQIDTAASGFMESPLIRRGSRFGVEVERLAAAR